MFNVGIVGFFVVGVYIFVILISLVVDGCFGGFDLYFVIGWVGVMIVVVFVVWLIGKICLWFCFDYLVIVLIGIVEIIWLVIKFELVLMNGVCGIFSIFCLMSEIGYMEF